MTMEEYPAESVNALQRQSSLPDLRSSATIAPSLPPGVQTMRSPSTSGDSEYPQPDIILPAKSLFRFLRQFSCPVLVSRQTKSPNWPSATTTSLSTVGVQRGPG